MYRSSYFAHSHEGLDPRRWHALSEHLVNTGSRAASFLAAVNCQDLALAAGILHDLGKYTEDFQSRLMGMGIRVDHSTAGAQVAIERYPGPVGKIIAFCVAGHHAGLANGVIGQRITALGDRLEATVAEPDPIWRSEITLPNVKPPRVKPRNLETAGFSAAFLIRMVFSALVDADYLDTEAWFANIDGHSPARGQHPSLQDLQGRLDSYLFDLTACAARTRVNRLRCEVLEHARNVATESQGVFTLTVPTGGGKTLTSLAFALDHAVRHGLDRVIYVIPFTSVVEQTAAVFRQALRVGEHDEASYVLEHHSAFDEHRIGKREAGDKLRLAMENWDVPVVVTTAVQFFESLFANRPSRCRKLHNVANSAIVLDEAQTLPLRFLLPCVSALDELARNWRTTVVLCTATQPALKAEDGFADGFANVREIAPDPKRLYRDLKRTRIRHAGTLDDEQLRERLSRIGQSLCIVNTRRHARELFEIVRPTPGAYHLSTAMCARHRRDVLVEIGQRLGEGLAVRLVATSLIEAGVDIDFPVVYRAEAGLESIIQAAGRCNREGKSAVSDVFVFEPAPAPGRTPPPEVSQLASAARSVMRSHDDPQALSAITRYFQEVYWIKGPQLDAHAILPQLNERLKRLDFPFETVARQFRLIETDMVPVIVPYVGSREKSDAVRRLISQLQWVERPGGIARALQPYLVSVPRRIRAFLVATRAARIVREEDFAEQFVELVNSDLYRSDVGLTWEDPDFRRAESLIL